MPTPETLVTINISGTLGEIVVAVCNTRFYVGVILTVWISVNM